MPLARIALVLVLFAASLPARADGGWKSGLQAPDVGHLVRGVVAEGVQVFVFAGCFLALDDNQTCVDIAGKARDDVADGA